MVHSHKKFTQTTSYLCQFEERLKFSTSHRIAPGVTFVFLSTFSLPQLSGDLEDVSNTIDKLFWACPHLPNLRGIRYSGYTITGNMILQIYQSSGLQSVHLLGDIYSDDVDAVAGELQDVQVKTRLEIFDF